MSESPQPPPIDAFAETSRAGPTYPAWMEAGNAEAVGSAKYKVAEFRSADPQKAEDPFFQGGLIIDASNEVGVCSKKDLQGIKQSKGGMFGNHRILYKGPPSQLYPGQQSSILLDYQPPSAPGEIGQWLRVDPDITDGTKFKESLVFDAQVRRFVLKELCSTGELPRAMGIRDRQYSTEEFLDVLENKFYGGQLRGEALDSFAKVVNPQILNVYSRLHAIEKEGSADAAETKRRIEMLKVFHTQIQERVARSKPAAKPVETPAEQPPPVISSVDGVRIGETRDLGPEIGRIQIIKSMSDKGSTSTVFEVQGLSGPHKGEKFIMKRLRSEFVNKESFNGKMNEEYELLKQMKAAGASTPEPLGLSSTRPPALFMSEAKGHTLRFASELNPLPARFFRETGESVQMRGMPEELALQLGLPFLDTLKIAHGLGISYTDWNIAEVFWDGKLAEHKRGQAIPPEDITVIDWNVTQPLDNTSDSASIQRNIARFAVNWLDLMTTYKLPPVEIPRHPTFKELSPGVQQLILSCVRGEIPNDKPVDEVWKTVKPFESVDAVKAAFQQQLAVMNQ